MSLFTRPIRPDADLDDAVERYLTALRAQITVDPMFRRRLRGQTMNHYVAARERMRTGAAEAHHVARMGRLGRAVLLASVALASTSAIGLASSQGALPGDPLYGVKLRVEELRFQAVPDDLHGMLAVDVAGERIEEMARLVDAGRVVEAQALRPAIVAALERVVAIESEEGNSGRARAAQQLALLQAYLVHLPAQAREVVGDSLGAAVSSVRSPGRPAAATPPSGGGDGREPATSNDEPGTGVAPSVPPGRDGLSTPRPTPAEQRPRPEPSPAGADGDAGQHPRPSPRGPGED